MADFHLILGGGSSGKSLHAEQRASSLAADKLWPVYYLATAMVLDQEFEKRVDIHRRRRPNNWITWEEPLQPASLLHDYDGGPAILLLDGIGSWLTNLTLHQQEEEFHWDHNREDWCWQQVEAFIEAGRRFPGIILLVADEVGMDLVPPTRLGRVFRDLNGKVNQRLAEIAVEACLIVAGQQLVLK
jgi:adenosylcobinamide kinase/adenosylcobinamide-phosphate guanylyltransferase